MPLAPQEDGPNCGLSLPQGRGREAGHTGRPEGGGIVGAERLQPVRRKEGWESHPGLPHKFTLTTHCPAPEGSCPWCHTQLSGFQQALQGCPSLRRKSPWGPWEVGVHSWAPAWASAGAEPLGWSEEKEEELETRVLPAGLADQTPCASLPPQALVPPPTPTPSFAQLLPKAPWVPLTGPG